MQVTSPVDAGEQACFAYRCKSLAVSGSICHVVNALITRTKPALTKTFPDDVKDLASASLDIIADAVGIEVTLGQVNDIGCKYHRDDCYDVFHAGANLSQ